MKIQFAKGCAWRAFYVNRTGSHGYEHQIFSLGIDPSWRTGQAKLFGSVGFRKSCTGKRIGTWNWSLMLPRSRYWWHLDGRYGTLRRSK